MLNKKSTHLFENLPIWKSLIRTSTPAMIMMLTWGLYSFTDSLLSINLAYSNYEYLETSTNENAKDLVRIFMNSFGPISAIMFGISMLTSSAISRRYSIHLGAKNKQRAIQVLQTTTMAMLTISIILVPILLLTAKPWIMSLYSNSGYKIAKIIADESYKYYWIIIAAYPLNIFNRICLSILSSEAKNKKMLFAIIIPIFFNLLFDYILMGPAKMGIQGGAIASLISFFITSIILIIFLIKSDSKISKFKNMFGFKNFRWLILLGCVLVGMPVLIGEFTGSFVQTVTIQINQEVSNSIYDDPKTLIILTTATNPIIMLFFPALWAVSQGARPIIGYNYGAKKFKRVKQTVFWTALYTFSIGLILYVLSTFLLAEPLFKLFGLSNERPNGQNIPIIAKAKVIFRIIMISLLLLAPLTTSIALFGSTDRIGLSLLSSLLRNVIIALLLLYIFKYIAQTYPGNKNTNLSKVGTMFSKEYIFLWKIPTTILFSGLIIIWPMFYTLKNLDVKHEQLEDKINRIILKFENKRKNIKNMKQKKN